MKIITNETIIKRNSRIGYIASLLSPVLLVISANMFFTTPEQIVYSLALFILGFFAFQVGKILRKWGRGADIEMNKALKKLGNDYSIFHFSTPVSHLLVGPAGIWILVPRYALGMIRYNEKRKRWKLVRQNILTKTLSIFMEGLGRPGFDIVGEADALDRYLRKKWVHEDSPHIDAALVFMHEDTVVEADNSEIPTLHLRDLRAFLRDQEKSNKVSPAILKKFIDLMLDY